MGLLAKELGRVLVTGSNYATANTLVTNATQKDTIITKITLYNDHTADVTVTLCRVLNNAGAVAVGVVTDIFWSQTINTKDTLILGHTDVSIPLIGTNDTIQVYADVASKVNVFADGFTLADQT